MGVCEKTNHSLLQGATAVSEERYTKGYAQLMSLCSSKGKVLFNNLSSVTNKLSQTQERCFCQDLIMELHLHKTRHTKYIGI